MIKQNMVYQYNEYNVILSSNNKEWTINKHSLDASLKNYAE